jgi:two-component system, sensor histidine kinase and response regulator
MKKSIVLLTALLFCTVISGQVSKEVDSLLKVLDTEKTDSNLLRTLNRIGSYYIDNNPTKAISYFERSAELAKKISNTLRQGNAYYDLGFCYLLKGDFDKSLDYYQQSEKIYSLLNDKRRLVNAYMSIGNVFFQNKSLSKATEYYTLAENIVQQTKDSNQLSTLYSERGLVYDQLKKYDSSLLYLQKAATVARLIKDDGMYINTLCNIGLTYKHINNTALALQYFDTVRNRYDAMPDVPLDYIAVLYNNIGATQAQAGNYAAATEAFNKSIASSQQAGIKAIEMENYRNMADMYANMKDYRLQSIFLTKHYNLKDSVFSADNKNQLTQLEADYQLEKKNISLVKQEAETVRQKNQRNVFIIIAIGAASLLAALGFFYRRIKQSNRLLQEKNTQINNQRDQLQTLNHVKDRLFSIISHDLRNPLTTLKSYLTLANDPGLPASQKEDFKKQTMLSVSQTSNMLDNLLTWANMQLKNTKPLITQVNTEDCIDDAIGAAAGQAAQKNITIHKKIDAPTAIAEYQILEIALHNIITNAIKYSPNGSNILISSSNTGQHVQIVVKDEGIGMNSGKINEILSSEAESTTGTAGEKGSGLGLFLVKELLQKIDAVLLIESEQGKGSSFIIQLPA